MSDLGMREKLEFFKAEIRMERLSIGDKAAVQASLMVVDALIEIRDVNMALLEAVLDLRDQGRAQN